MAQVGNAIELVTGAFGQPVDPQAEFVKPYVGDWVGVRQAADILRAVGHELNSIATNLDWASQNVEEVWQGNAGDGVALYLMGLARPLHEAWQPLDALAGAYVTAAEVKLRDAAVSILNEIGDAAIEAAAGAGIAAGSASTGVGAPVGFIAGLFAAYKAYRVLDGVREIFGVISKLDAATKVLKTTQTDFGTIHAGSLPKLPDRSFETPK